MPETQIKGHDIESTSLQSKISNDIDFTKVETDRINLTSVNPADTATFFGTDDSGNSTLHMRIGNGTGDKIQIESWNGSAATSLMEINQTAVVVQNAITCNDDISAVNATFSGDVSASNITLNNDVNANNANVDAVNITSVNPVDTATFFGTDDSGNSTLHMRIGNGTGDKIQIESWNGSSATSLMEIDQTTVTIKGDLIVSGTTTTVNSETLEVADNYIILNSGVVGSPTLDAGIKVERGSEADVEFKWNETEDKWETTSLKITDNLYIGAEKVTAVPIGTILMYDGTGIADVASRSEDIGDRAGDTISLPGWKVCNGNGGTPNLLNKFIRSEATSGNTGGSDDAIVVNHSHTMYHTHSINHDHGSFTSDGSGTLYTNYTDPDLTHHHTFNIGTSTNQLNYPMSGYSYNKSYPTSDTDKSMSHRHSINSHTHTINPPPYSGTSGGSSSANTGSQGSSGTGKNMPAYYSLIFIKRIN